MAKEEFLKKLDRVMRLFGLVPEKVKISKRQVEKNRR